MPRPNLVDTDGEETEMEMVDVGGGEMMGYKVKEYVETGSTPLAAYAATRSELPTWMRVGFGAVALVGAPKFLKKVKRMFGMRDRNDR